MTEEEFDEFLQVAADELDRKQAALTKEYGLGGYADFAFDQATGTVRFMDADGRVRVEAAATPIGQQRLLMRVQSSLALICIAIAVSVTAGCGNDAKPPATAASQGGDIQLSDNVIKLLRENDTKTAAVKAHQEESDCRCPKLKSR
ncbi:MAG TPA: hypothetical protein VGN57_09965 [Pirellulaceae bacterium]|jgi:hypothetical protein|nr:hypothetical protein [Pirellulaceae bacterium]